MHIVHPNGLIAVALAVICFYGTTYAVIALNIGWRFGYWVCSAVFGALMFLMAIFWLVNPVGPRGGEGHWIPLTAATTIKSADFKGKPLTSPGQYPGSPWKKVSSGDPQGDAFSSAVSTCLSTKPDLLNAEEKTACDAAQALMPKPEQIPVLAGSSAAVVGQVTDTALTVENGDLAMAIIRPVTTDPRVTKSPKGKLLAPPFQIVAILDHGSLRKPPLVALFIFSIYFAFHLWGLNRAEKRKLNPAVI
jgi:hypothetical protein